MRFIPRALQNNRKTQHASPSPKAKYKAIWARWVLNFLATSRLFQKFMVTRCIAQRRSNGARRKSQRCRRQQTPSRKSYHLPNDISLEELFGQECLMVCWKVLVLDICRWRSEWCYSLTTEKNECHLSNTTACLLALAQCWVMRTAGEGSHRTSLMFLITLWLGWMYAHLSCCFYLCGFP